jgi:L-iditol 2-dehydrogenase
MMRALFMPSPGRVALGEFDVPRLSAGEVLVRMDYASVCGSDTHAVYGGFHNPQALGKPGYPGHEGVGVVVDSRSERLGTGVPVLTVPPGETGGCFAEYQAVDEDHVIALRPGADPRRLLMAQQLGTTIYALKKFSSADVGTAGVIGAGSAGLFFVQLLFARGCRQVIVSDVNEARLRVAERLGAVGVLAQEGAFPQEVLRHTEGVGADLVIETAGLDVCRAEAVHAVRPHGVVGCFGYAERFGLAGFPVHLAFRKAATVAWARGTQSEPGLVSFREAIGLVEAGAIDIEDHLRYVIPLGEAPDGLETARARKDVVKVLISIDGRTTAIPAPADAARREGPREEAEG